MTKLALALALMGCFGAGFHFGGINSESGNILSSPASSTRGPASLVSVKLALSHEPSAPVSKSKAVDIPAISPGSVSSPLASPEKSFTNADFSRLVRDCQGLEANWRGRIFADKVIDIWSLEKSGLNRAEVERIQNKFTRQAGISLHWLAQAPLMIDGDQLLMQASVLFNRQGWNGEDQTCWRFDAFYEKDGQSVPLGGGSGCGSVTLNAEGMPIVEKSTYASDKIGSLVSSFIFSMDVDSKHSKLEYLPAVSPTEEWLSVELPYRPISEAEYVEFLEKKNKF